MSYPIPKELKGEERLFVIKWINVPVSKKSLFFNGPATLLAIIMGKLTGNTILLIGLGIILNVLVYPMGNGKVSNKKFDNGGMNYDKYLLAKFKWFLNKGGNVFLSYKKDVS